MCWKKCHPLQCYIISFTFFTKSSILIGFLIKLTSENKGEDVRNLLPNSSVYPSPNAVKKQILTLLSIFLISSYSSKPFILGIFISRNRRSYFLPALKIESANRGSVNVSTSNPPSSKPIVKIEALSGSSSTTKIFLLFSSLIFDYLSSFLRRAADCLSSSSLLSAKVKVNVAPFPSRLFSAHIFPP